MSDYLDPNNEELMKDFFVEAQLMVETLEKNILALENDPGDRDAVDEIFRAAHTLKGSSSTVQITVLSEFTHLVEDVLDEIRSDTIRIDEDVIDLLLDSIDIIKGIMDAKSNGEEYEEDISQTEKRLHGLLEGGQKEAAAHKAQEQAGKDRKEGEKAGGSGAQGGSGGASAGGGKGGGAASADSIKGSLTEYEMLELREVADGQPAYRIIVSFNEDNPMNTVGGIQVFAVLKGEGQVLRTVPDFESLYEDNFFPDVEYYVVTDLPPDELSTKIQLPDVTTNVRIDSIDDITHHADTSPAETPADEAETGGAKTSAAAEESGGDSSVPESAEGKAGEEEAEVPVPEEAGQDSAAGDTGKPPAAARKKKAKKEEKSGGAASSILRVDSKRIDNLLNLVSETVINKATFNQISSKFAENLMELQNNRSFYTEKLKDLFEQLPEIVDQLQSGKTIKEVKRSINEEYGDLFTVFDSFEGQLKSTVNEFKSTAQNLGRTTGELHEGVLRIRMVPINQIFSRFPRIVRDLSKNLSKKVNLVIEGEDTELDKSVIEDLLDPLLHCVRNSLDHGLENPEARKKAGKDPEGTVVLRASNEGNIINIEIIDDGKGIDVDSVRQKAIDRGVIHPSKTISDMEAYNLIFDPGFSTAKKISDVSGRGVGLDVVKRQIEKLNGNVSVWSEKGKGSKFTIKLPLTLAIIQGLLVRVGTEIYAIPITSVIESHRIDPSEIKVIDNYEVFNVRDEVISLLRLDRLFSVQSDEKQDYNFIVIVGTGEKKMGLMVDSLIGEEDVVIKPLKDKYTNSPGIAGATILGDGKVSLIIDVSQLLELGLKKEIAERKRREELNVN